MVDGHERGFERGPGGQYDRCYRVFDSSIAVCCEILVWGLRGGGEVGMYVRGGACAR